MKNCKTCRVLKPSREFYKLKSMRDGLTSSCKACTRERVQAHRLANIDRIRRYDRKRAKEPKKAAKIREIVVRWRQENPEKYRAQTAVGNALRDGKLNRKPCEVCGSRSKIHAHHDDYSKPLSVRWLCPEHHAAHHRDHS